MQRMNGHQHPQAMDHTPILMHIAGKLGHIEARQMVLIADVRDLKRSASKPVGRPMYEWIALLISVAGLAAAVAGKITWAEALPSLTGLVGH